MASTHGKMFEYDELQMFFGEDYALNEYITIHQPSIMEIVNYGEKDYYSMVYTLCGIPSDSKYFLFDLGIDYEEMGDFEYFILISKLFPQERTAILFGDLNLQKFVIEPVEDEFIKVRLVNPETGCIIDRMIYQKMIDYVREMHNIVPKVEKAMDAQTKRFLIDEDRMKHKPSKVKKKDSSFLRPLISAMLNSPGFKYNKNELKEVGIVEFMDSVQRIPLITHTQSIMNGMYCMADTSKIKPKDLDWMREIEQTQSKGLGIKLT